jgi:hypothetical protein
MYSLYAGRELPTVEKSTPVKRRVKGEVAGLAYLVPNPELDQG